MARSLNRVALRPVSRALDLALRGHRRTLLSVAAVLLAVPIGVAPGCRSGHHEATGADSRAQISAEAPKLRRADFAPATAGRHRESERTAEQTIYLIHAHYLVAVKRTSRLRATPTAALQALLRGPRDDEKRVGVRTALPLSLVLKAVSVRDRRALIELVDSRRSVRRRSLSELAAAQLVYTITDTIRVSSVTIRFGARVARVTEPRGAAIVAHRLTRWVFRPFDPNRLALKIYLIKGTALTGVTRIVPRTRSVARSAFHLLLEGPTLEERRRGLRTSVMAKTRVRTLAIAGGVVAIDLTLRTSRPTLRRAALAQIVYTLTQFPAVRAVQVTVVGRPVRLPQR